MTIEPEMIDSYQAEIYQLEEIYNSKNASEFSYAIHEHWRAPEMFGQLFGFTSPNRQFLTITPEGSLAAKDRKYTGCLTQIRRGDEAWTPELTAAIRADERIPENWWDIEHPEQLPVFREWQLRLDRELGRETKMVPNPRYQKPEVVS